MIRTRIEVRNMACEMCEAHVIEAVRKILSHGEAHQGLPPQERGDDRERGAAL